MLSWLWKPFTRRWRNSSSSSKRGREATEDLLSLSSDVELDTTAGSQVSTRSKSSGSSDAGGSYPKQIHVHSPACDHGRPVSLYVHVHRPSRIKTRQTRHPRGRNRRAGKHSYTSLKRLVIDETEGRRRRRPRGRGRVVRVVRVIKTRPRRRARGRNRAAGRHSYTSLDRLVEREERVQRRKRGYLFLVNDENGGRRYTVSCVNTSRAVLDREEAGGTESKSGPCVVVSGGEEEVGGDAGGSTGGASRTSRPSQPVLLDKRGRYRPLLCHRIKGSY